MKEKYLKPSAETVLFDINEVNMEFAYSSPLDSGESHSINLLNGDGLNQESDALIE